MLLRQNWPNVTKVYPVKMNRMIHMADFFNISSSFLLDEPVIGSNGDISKMVAMIEVCVLYSVHCNIRLPLEVVSSYTKSRQLY